MKKPSKSITTDGVTFKATPYTITSSELHALVNTLRIDSGEKEIRYRDFAPRIVDELSDVENFYSETFAVEKNSNGTEMEKKSCGCLQAESRKTHRWRSGSLGQGMSIRQGRSLRAVFQH